MSYYCTQCGHQLGVGRYCTNCGRAVADAATAEPAPAPGSVPPPARYPLYADEARPVAAPPATPSPAPGQPAPGQPALSQPAPGQPALSQPAPGQPAPGPAVETAPGPTPHRRASRRPWLLPGAAAAVALVVATAALWTLGDDDEPDRVAEGSSSEAAPGEQGPPPGDADGGSEAGDLRAASTVEVPATAPPGVSADGERTTYDAANLLDGVPETAWRMPGDGTGAELVVTLPAETTLRSVGLINGYAKIGTGPRGGNIDWYLGNRRIERVEWVFDDGTTLAQDLDETMAVQSVDVDVTTATVMLRLVAVSAPGTGPNGRDFTAISDLALVAG